MNYKQICPECRQALAKNKTECFCGWKVPQTIVTRKKDNRCEYVLGERRCPLPGVICPFPHGSGPWYCGGHWKTLIDPKLAEAVLRDAEENYKEILESRIDWRNELGLIKLR